MYVVKSNQELQLVLQQHDRVIVDFFATWCGPCKHAAVKFAALEPQFPNLAFIKVDIDQGQDIANEYEISAVPSFILFHQGKQVEKIIGMDKLDMLVSKASAAQP